MEYDEKEHQKTWATGDDYLHRIVESLRDKFDVPIEVPKEIDRHIFCLLTVPKFSNMEKGHREWFAKEVSIYMGEIEYMVKENQKIKRQYLKAIEHEDNEMITALDARIAALYSYWDCYGTLMENAIMKQYINPTDVEEDRVRRFFTDKKIKHIWDILNEVIDIGGKSKWKSEIYIEFASYALNGICYSLAKRQNERIKEVKNSYKGLDQFLKVLSSYADLDIPPMEIRIDILKYSENALKKVREKYFQRIERTDAKRFQKFADQHRSFITAINQENARTLCDKEDPYNYFTMENVNNAKCTGERRYFCIGQA